MFGLFRKLTMVLGMCLIVAVALCGCGGSSEPTPTETANTFLTAVKAGDTETIKTVYAGEDLDILSPIEGEDSDGDKDDSEDVTDDEYFEELLLTKLLDFDYELSNEQITEDKATVDVTITTYDLGKVFTAFMEEYFAKALEMSFDGASDEEIEKVANSTFESKLNEEETKTYTETVPLTLSKQDGIWKVDPIDDDGDFMNVICGNALHTMDQLEEDYSFDDQMR